jgi:hypothetical protein
MVVLSPGDHHGRGGGGRRAMMLVVVVVRQGGISQEDQPACLPGGHSWWQAQWNGAMWD